MLTIVPPPTFIHLKGFGEGMTILDGKVYMLTWTSGVAYIFDELTFELLETFKFTTTTGEVSYLTMVIPPTLLVFTLWHCYPVSNRVGV